MTDRGDTITDLYDEYIRDTGGEVKSSEAMEAILPAVVDLIANDERDLNSEGRFVIRSTMTKVRAQRTNSLKRDLEIILDGFTEDGPYIDPLLDRAYGLGRPDGADKTLRMWTTEDLRFLVEERRDMAKKVSDAVEGLASVVGRVITRMNAAHATGIGDLA